MDDSPHLPTPDLSVGQPAGTPGASQVRPLPLAGVTVLDLTNVLSGPFCSYQLALMGAEVIKIEPPGQGDLARQLGADQGLNKAGLGTSFIAQNAGKKSLSLNLKAKAGKRIFLDLVKRADVVLENFRPGVMRRLGLGYDALKAVNPSLVYCAISGFGQEGPLKDNPAYDQIIQGLSGLMSVTGDTRSAPLRVGFPLCDTFGGMTAAFAIAAALAGRKPGDEGRYIDVSMLDSTLVALGWVVSNFLTAGVTPQPMGNENMTAAPSGTFATKQGLLNISANKQEQFEALCDAVGRPDLKTDPRFAERDTRKRNRAALKEELESALAAEPAEMWEETLNAASIPAGRVLSVPEILAHPQTRARALIQDLGPMPGTQRRIQVARTGFHLDGRPLDAASHPPRLGEHATEVLGRVGIADDELTKLRAEGVV